ncbi:hypothetical protein K402DRAFT_404397 [Aulographum hederae CBS 113979]|uniref:N-acetyltransferase domain-containing protein n=1 Tax=Aulographum hederae CBS 113979 TaxID=1176131 RepID=A0A6G1GZB1_9PEZI|nr:hypothetical protein K402DRAFT_404397 [Aulographum hederae CBS 113979]
MNTPYYTLLQSLFHIHQESPYLSQIPDPDLYFSHPTGEKPLFAREIAEARRERDRDSRERERALLRVGEEQETKKRGLQQQQQQRQEKRLGKQAVNREHHNDQKQTLVWAEPSHLKLQSGSRPILPSQPQQQQLDTDSSPHPRHQSHSPTQLHHHHYKMASPPSNPTILITVPVPPNYPSMSLPVDPNKRIPSSSITLSAATISDLPDIATALYTCFPEIWWGVHEPPSSRPEEGERIRRLAARFESVIRRDEGKSEGEKIFTYLVAREKGSGKFMGCAGWHHPIFGTRGDSKEDEEDTWNYNIWLADMPSTHAPPGTENWECSTSSSTSSPDRAELWQHVDRSSWAAEWSLYERNRRKLMGATPHWYLAPFVVVEEFRGKGVGKALLEWCFSRADAEEGKKVPVYLEALPNARPVYLHEGFVPVEEEGEGMGMVMIRNRLCQLRVGRMVFEDSQGNTHPRKIF